MVAPWTRRTRARWPLALAGGLAGLALLAVAPTSPGAPAGPRLAAPETALARVRAVDTSLPLSFEPNRGQAAAPVDFLARARRHTRFLTPTEAVLARREPAESRSEGASFAVLRLQLVDANPDAVAAGQDLLPGNVNHLRGSDPARWLTDLPTYARVRY